MATSYPTGVSTDYDADDSCTTNAASTIRDIHECAIRKPFWYYFTELTETDTSYAEQVDFYVYVPDFWASRTLYFVIESKVSGGTGYWKVIDKDNGDATVSDEVAVTDTSYAASTATITVPAGWTANTRRNIAISAKAAAGETIYLQNTDVIRCYVTD